MRKLKRKISSQDNRMRSRLGAGGAGLWESGDDRERKGIRMTQAEGTVVSKA